MSNCKRWVEPPEEIDTVISTVLPMRKLRCGRVELSLGHLELAKPGFEPRRFDSRVRAFNPYILYILPHQYSVLKKASWYWKLMLLVSYVSFP